jgi:predicted DNA-binding transcriptional regulator AlpA
MPPLILRTTSAAQYLGLSASTLEKKRLQGTGPRFTKLGTRAVGYFVEDLDAYAESGRRCSTSDKGAPCPAAAPPNDPRSPRSRGRVRQPA